MTLVEVQIETLKNLKNSFAGRDFSKFESFGQINKFQHSYSAEVRDTPSPLGRELDIEMAETKAASITLPLSLM